MGSGFLRRCCSRVRVPWEELQQGRGFQGSAAAGLECPAPLLARIGSLTFCIQEENLSITKGDKICSQIERSKGNLSPGDVCFMNYHGNALDRTDRKAKGMVASGYTKEVLSFHFLKTRRMDESKVCDSLHVADGMQHVAHKGTQGVQNQKHSHEVCSDSDFA